MSESVTTTAPVAKLTASIGTKGAHINYDDDFNHPLSFGINWGTDMDAELVEKGQALARQIKASGDLLEVCRNVLAAWDATPLQYLVSAPLREVDWEGIRAAIAKATTP